MNKNKIITIILSLIIVLGIVITLTSGFNVDILSKEHKEIQLDLEKEFEASDIKDIAKEVFEGQAVEIQKVEVYEEQVLISTEEITDEQKSNLVTKINEKYQTEIKAEDVTVITVPKIKLADYITPHIFEFILVTIVVAIYMCIRYKKLGFLKVLVQTILGIIIAESLAFSVLAITRIAVGNNLVVVMFVIYAVTLFALTNMFENKLQKMKLEETNK